MDRQPSASAPLRHGLASGPREAHMAATLRHFAINADDVPRARSFYEAVFGWSFTPWGPPGFYQVKNAGEGLMGALQGRRPIEDQVMPGIETTFAVEDLDAAIAAIEANGGRVFF